MSPALTIEVRLPDDQLERLADLLHQRAADSAKPLTIPQAAEALGVSDDTIRLRVKAGQIKTVPASAVGSRKMIPASEMRRLLNPQPGGDGS